MRNVNSVVRILLTDLHATTETEDQVESALLLDVVVGQGATILQLLTSENQSLLVGGDALLVLNLGLDVVNGIGGLDLKSDGLARESLNEDLHLGGVCSVKMKGSVSV